MGCRPRAGSGSATQEGVHFQLRFDPQQIHELAKRYRYPNEDAVSNDIARAVRQRGYFTRDEFLTVGYWKSPRNQKRYARNSEEFVRAVTEAALSAKHERLRIEALTLLDGVGWPTASVLLHFVSTDPYPLLDFRALWSVGVEVPRDADAFNDFDLWWPYTQFRRRLSQTAGVSTRGSGSGALAVLEREPEERSSARDVPPRQRRGGAAKFRNRRWSTGATKNPALAENGVSECAI